MEVGRIRLRARGGSPRAALGRERRRRRRGRREGGGPWVDTRAGMRWLGPDGRDLGRSRGGRRDWAQSSPEGLRQVPFSRH